MLNETQQKGLVTELKCQLFFIENGYNIYLPVSEDSRYDLIVDINNNLYRVQIKTSHLTSNNTGIEFNVCSSRVNHTEGNIKVGYSEDEIDFFMTTYNNNFYLIPIEICGRSSKTLSFNQSLNGAATLLEDYNALKMIKEINNIEYYEKKKGNKKIGQYDKKTLTLINTFNSISDAAREINKDPNTCAGHISQVANGKRKTAYGFIWKFMD